MSTGGRRADNGLVFLIFLYSLETSHKTRVVDLIAVWEMIPFGGKAHRPAGKISKFNFF